MYHFFRQGRDARGFLFGALLKNMIGSSRRGRAVEPQRCRSKDVPQNTLTRYRNRVSHLPGFIGIFCMIRAFEQQ